MRIYIAASWKHQAAVQLLTATLRERCHEVKSFVENNNEDPDCLKSGEKRVPFEEWCWTKSGERSFCFDTKWAAQSDLVIYLGPSGQDAAAEIGVAWANRVRIFGIWGKGEGFGLMRRMVEWKDDILKLLEAVEALAQDMKTLSLKTVKA